MVAGSLLDFLLAEFFSLVVGHDVTEINQAFDGGFNDHPLAGVLDDKAPGVASPKTVAGRERVAGADSGFRMCSVIVAGI